MLPTLTEAWLEVAAQGIIQVFRRKDVPSEPSFRQRCLHWLSRRSPTRRAL